MTPATDARLYAVAVDLTGSNAGPLFGSVRHLEVEGSSRASDGDPIANRQERAEAENDLFPDDLDAESPLVIRSCEIGRAFPQGVPGDRVSRCIDQRIAEIASRAIPPNDRRKT